MKRFSTYEEVKTYLYGLKHHGAKYGIDRMVLLAASLGHPDRSYPVVHIAGTNGKGSTCAMLESIHRAHGRRTGLYTSPHLVFQGERIQIDRQILDHESIRRYTEELQEHAERLAAVDPDDHPSFFEFMTGMAFLHFQRKAVDVAFVETGLGGRLDATNVVKPEVCVITSIGLDHQEQLGETLEQVAAEKAGIIKPGVPVVLGLLPSAAEAVVRAVAKEEGCPVTSVKEVFGEDLDTYPETNLFGAYQRANAAAALLAARATAGRLPVDEATARKALLEVQWAGRWDPTMIGGRRVILDTTHNAEGAVALAENLRALTAEIGRKPVILAGTLGERRAQALMPVAAEWAEELHLLVPGQARAADYETLEAALPRDISSPVRRSKVAELFPGPDQCAIGQPGDTIVATGSIYLIGEILERTRHFQPVDEQILQDTLLPGR